MYLLFYGSIYYPSGGACDFQGSYDTIEEAKDARESQQDDYGYSWAQITDDGLNILLEYESGDGWTDTNRWGD